MKILAFDGTAKAATVAVTEDQKILGYYTIDNGLTQSELLLPMAENLLRSLNLNFSDIELYATSVGPGSFTGVRIGVSLIKGLAFGRSFLRFCSVIDRTRKTQYNFQNIFVLCNQESPYAAREF